MHELRRGDVIADPMLAYLAVDRSGPLHECWVTGHMVAGLDGTASIGGRVGALSTAPDQALFRQMRQIADVVLVGAETVRREGYGVARLDDSARAARRERGQSDVPPIAVVSRSLDLDLSSRFFTDAPEGARPLVITCEASDPARRVAAAEVATVLVAGGERVESRAALTVLADLGHRVVLCEGGPRLLGQLVADDRLDELCLSISPVMGGDPLPVAVTPQGAGIANFALAGAMVDGDTIFLRYARPERDGGPDA